MPCYRDIPFGHVEAGLRTNNLRAPFPEAGNRVLTGKLTTLHFAPTEWSKKNLLTEHVPADRIFVTGNTVIDASRIELAKQKKHDVAAHLRDQLTSLLFPRWEDARLVLVTGHRRESFGSGFANICKALNTLATANPTVHFVYPVHLNPNVQRPVHDLLDNISNLHLLQPLPYREFLALLSACYLVLTDSGGVQEEAPGLAKPVLVMRGVTERPEGVEAGTVALVGTDSARIVEAVTELLDDEDAYQRMARARNPYGDGYAAARIVKVLETFLS